MFIIFFSLFVFLFTVFEDRKIAILILSSSIIGIIIRYIFVVYNGKSFFKYLLIISISFLLAGGAWLLYNYHSPQPCGSQIFIENGQVVDILGQGKYEIISQDKTYILYAKKDHQLGEYLWLVGNIAKQSSYTSSEFQDNILYSGFNIHKRMKMKGYTSAIYENNSITYSGIIPNGLPRTNILLRTRILFREKIIHTYTNTFIQNNNQTAALVLGMLIGDKSLFSKSDYQSFIDSGLVHLVAVSGGNIVMLVTFLMAILFFIPFYPRLVIILLIVLGYGMICGMDSSVVRAVLMGGMSLLALFRGRKPSTRRMLGIAYITMLIYNPYFLVYDVGFLLSFGAVIGIVICSTKIISQEDIEQIPKPTSGSKLIKCCTWIRKDNLHPTLGATLGIFPIIIFFMGKINMVSLVGNLLVLPIVSLIMIGGCIGIRLPGSLAKFVFLGENLLVNWVFIVSQKVSEWGIYIVVEDLWIKYSILGISIFAVGIRQYLLTRRSKTLTAKRLTQTDLDKADDQNKHFPSHSPLSK